MCNDFQHNSWGDLEAHYEQSGLINSVHALQDWYHKTNQGVPCICAFIFTTVVGLDIGCWIPFGVSPKRPTSSCSLGAGPHIVCCKNCHGFHIIYFCRELPVNFTCVLDSHFTGAENMMSSRQCHKSNLTKLESSLWWRHKGCDGVSKHQPHDCSLNRLLSCRSTKTSKLRVTGLCAGNSPATG